MTKQKQDDKAAMFAAIHEEQHRTQKLRNLLGRASRPAALNPPAALDRAAALALSGTSCVIDGSVVQRAESRLRETIEATHDEVVVVTIGADRETGIVDLYVTARENGHLAHRPNVRAVAIVTNFESCPASVLARLDGQEIPYVGVLSSSRILVSPV